MKSIAATVLLAAGLARAVLDTTIEGVDVSIQLTRDNGEDLPVYIRELEPEMAAALERRQSLQKRDVSTSENWCGAAVYNPHDDPTTKFTQVVGTWTVPAISLRDNQTVENQPSIAQWIGIDGGGACATGLIQGGTASQIFTDGLQHDSAWWEFVPGALTAIEMEVGTGDVMSANVTTTSPTAGIFAITNMRTGVTLTVTIPNGNGTICGHQADWVLEDLTVGGLAPFASFAPNTFTDNLAVTADGQTIDASGADTINLVQNGIELCSATLDGCNINMVPY